MKENIKSKVLLTSAPGVGMTTKPILVVTHLNQTQFDGFSPFWLGSGMSLGFPRFQNTGMGRVTGI